MSAAHTSGIKLSEIRPCDACGGPISPIFRVVEIKMAVFSQKNTNQVLGLNQFFGGAALGLAEIFAPGADQAVMVCEEPDGIDRLFICDTCLCGDLNLAILSEKISDARKVKEEALAE